MLSHALFTFKNISLKVAEKVPNGFQTPKIIPAAPLPAGRTWRRSSEAFDPSRNQTPQVTCEMELLETLDLENKDRNGVPYGTMV